MKTQIQRTSIAWLISSLVLLCLWSIAGCSQSGTEIPQKNSPIPPSQTFTASPTSEETPRDLPTTTAEIELSPTPAVVHKPQYEIQADLDYSLHRVRVDESVVISQPADSTLTEISLAVPANNWPGVFSLEQVAAGSHTVENYQLNGVVLTLKFTEPYWQPGETLELDFSFTLDLPRVNAQVGYGPSAFGYTELATNLVDWYVMVPPYQTETGWLIHDPWIFGEYLVYPAADFEISLSLDSPGLTVAASSIPVSEDGSLQYELENARNFGFSISTSYIVLEGEVDGVQVLGYIYPGYQVPGQAAFDATLEALDLYQRLFGPYQQSSLSMIQADFNHGVEYEGLYFLSRGFFDSYSGSEDSYLIAIAVHETAHQWWYGQVANDQALEPWLDEALCTFSELAYYEQLHPESLDWWWAVRVDYYQPFGRLDRSIYGFTQFADQYLAYRNATYLQGAKFLSQLKTVMGEDAYYNFLGRYAAFYQDEIASGEDFFGLLEETLNLSDQAWMEEYFPEIRQLSQ